MKFLKLKRVWLGLFCLFLIGLLTSCAGTRILMTTAPSTPKGAIATPALTALSKTDWENQKNQIQLSLEKEIYGIMPKDFGTTLMSSRPIKEHEFKANIEEITVKTIRSETYKAIIVTPKNSGAPLPIIMTENFCPNHSVIPANDISKPVNAYFDCDTESLMGNVFGYFFGRYIRTPPVDLIMEHGYALAVIYPSETFPDNAARFEPHRHKAPSPSYPWGAVAAWAYQFSSLSDYLKSDGRFSKTIAYGHSRYGKSALVAAAYDDTIDGAIAHQSGTGGASLSRNKKGETVAAITEGYPHWFTPAYKEDTLTIDQHHLLALIAPRPILLGNAKRDVWSDPEGAFRAAKGAAPAYAIHGSAGLRQSKLTEFDPSADIAFWMRPGTHGVVKEDWPAFLEFMDAHFK